MQFLGTLGIDVHILLAQIANFGILLIALSYFVYTPTIRAIEENERALLEGAKLKQSLAQAEQSFEAKKRDDIAATRERNAKSVRELSAMAESLKAKTLEQARAESAALVAQTKEILESERPAIVDEITREVRMKLIEDFSVAFAGRVPDDYRSELESTLFRHFIERLKAAELEKLSEQDVQELQELRLSDHAAYEKRLHRKFGTVLLEHAADISPQEIAEVGRIVSEKVGLDIEIAVRQDPALISGFRLEINGRLIENAISSMFADHD